MPKDKILVNLKSLSRIAISSLNIWDLEVFSLLKFPSVWL